MSTGQNEIFFSQPIIEQLPKAADTLLKSVGLLGVAGFLANVAKRSDTLWLGIPLWISCLALLAFGVILATVAILKAERVIVQSNRKPKWVEFAFGLIVSVLLTISVQAAVVDFLRGDSTVAAPSDGSKKVPSDD